MGEVEKRVVLAVDAGLDDAMAMLIFLYAMKIGILKIEAIICTHGNTARENVVKNVVRLLEITGRTDIPVYRGSKDSFILPSSLKEYDYFGKDGFGDLKYDHDPDLSIVKTVPGAIAMHKLVTNNPNQISFVSLGGLTDFALAAKLYEDFFPNIKELWIMGGNYKDMGNKAEFNFLVDPEASNIVLNSTLNKVHLFPCETCRLSMVTWDWRFNVLGKSTYPASKLVTMGDRNVLQLHQYETYWRCCDAQAAAAFAFEKEIILSQNDYCASVELHGSQTRGQVTIGCKGTTPNARVIEKIDYEYYKKVLLKSVYLE